ncbi:AraC family transcriptional regulator [Hydrogenovibrio sp. JE_KL2]|uniref:helix-turn-helix domain-containing protein n=1 Tax=Hydrogenovibrio sp. JE_KL2 TaxID=2651188 RepID=UPI00128DA1CB|nr:AraC family transcriptional regulator [Hydrogenovibrio sp. JE_KL2]MPQ76739.1 helix-turn-helix transcriptional regulator [Hydrogenovibrio sp. JE_KL2]
MDISPPSPFDLIQYKRGSSVEDLNHLIEKEKAAGDIWIAKSDRFIEKDIINIGSGPPAFCITFFFDGKGHFSMKNGLPIAIEANTIFLYCSPNTCEGTDHLCKNTKLHCLHLRFPSNQSTDFTRFIAHLLSPALKANASTQDAFLASIPMNGVLKNIAMDIFNCDLPQGIARQLFLQAKSLESLSLLMAFLEENLSYDQPLSQSDKKRVYQAAKLIDKTFHHSWTIAELSKKVGLNEKKLKQGFRTLIHTTIHDYLEKTRLLAAKEMLRNGVKVTDTALATGYSNPSHFTKYFKKRFHLSPREWAKHNQKALP